MLDEHTGLVIDEICSLVPQTKKQHPRVRCPLTFLERRIARYYEPWRYYHNIIHIADGFKMLRPLYGHIKDPMSLWWAWLYHDMSFEPGSPTSEHCSGLLARHDLKMIGVPEKIAQTVYAMILATCGHNIPENFSGTESDLALMLDVDLSGLGDPFEKYKEVGDRIRKEFGHCTDEEWVEGRAAFSEGMLAKDQIFKTEHFAHLEDQARKNLQWAVDEAA